MTDTPTIITNSEDISSPTVKKETTNTANGSMSTIFNADGSIHRQISLDGQKAVKEAQRQFEHDDMTRGFASEKKLKANIPMELIYETMDRTKLSFSEATKYIMQDPNYKNIFWRDV